MLFKPPVYGIRLCPSKLTEILGIPYFVWNF